MLDVGFLDPLVYRGILAVLVVLVLVELVRVVGRIADDDGYLFGVLPLDPFGVLGADGEKAVLFGLRSCAFRDFLCDSVVVWPAGIVVNLHAIYVCRR